LTKGPLLRSSWLQRRSKEALVDVRIIEDEVNIKITKKKKAIGCLLPVSRAVDDLHLQLLNLAGGIIGECHVYMFNTQVIYYFFPLFLYNNRSILYMRNLEYTIDAYMQIMEGSSVYASAVAKKLIEVIDMY
jgi:hypothetical protein